MANPSDEEVAEKEEFVFMSVRVPYQSRKELKDAANNDNTSVQDIVAGLIEKYLEERRSS